MIITCLHLPTPSSSLLANAEKTMSFMMANATPSTGDAMVQTEWRSPTVSALLMAVKLVFTLHDQRVKNRPLHNHGDQQAELTVHRAKVQLTDQKMTDRLMMRPPPQRGAKWTRLEDNLEDFLTAWDNAI